jgi:hypothetical protein
VTITLIAERERGIAVINWHRAVNIASSISGKAISGKTRIAKISQAGRHEKAISAEQGDQQPRETMFITFDRRVTTICLGEMATS